jgi:hypothetical protein
MTPRFKFLFAGIGKTISEIFTSRKKTTIGIICTCLFLYLGLAYFQQSQHFPSQWPELNKKFPAEDSSKFLINTPGCTIPWIPIFPSYYRNNWHEENIPVCNYETVLSDLSEDGVT